MDFQKYTIKEKKKKKRKKERKNKQTNKKTKPQELLKIIIREIEYLKI